MRGRRSIAGDALDAKYRPTLGRHAAAALTNVLHEDLRTPAHGYWVAVRRGPLSAPRIWPPPKICHPLAWCSACPRPSAGGGHLGPDCALDSRPRAARRRRGYVGELVVAPNVRRQRVGATLMEHLDARATALGKSRLTLWVTDDNAPARALYTGLGSPNVPSATGTWAVWSSAPEAQCSWRSA